MFHRQLNLWVPDDKDHILKILESEYDTKVASHMA
jgi:hypothetical protein